MNHMQKWIQTVILFLLVCGFSFVLAEVDTTQKYLNDSIEMTYEQVNALNLKIDNVEQKIDRSHATLVPLGVFTVTYYCNSCGECGTDGTTADGTELTEGMYSIATDPDIIPLGTIIQIDGKQYVANDTGGAIDGNRIDIMVYGKTHEEVLAMGVNNFIVYSVEEVSYE